MFIGAVQSSQLDNYIYYSALIIIIIDPELRLLVFCIFSLCQYGGR